MTRTSATHDQQRRQILAGGDRIWDRLVAILDARPGEALHRPPSPTWTSRDIYAHLARWQDQSIAFIEHKRAGHSPQPFTGDADAVNAKWAVDDAVLTLDQARGRCHTARGRLKALLLDLSPSEWDHFGRGCLADIDGRHYQEHLDAIP